jgi:hypothetical protein
MLINDNYMFSLAVLTQSGLIFTCLSGCPELLIIWITVQFEVLLVRLEIVIMVKDKLQVSTTQFCAQIR